MMTSVMLFTARLIPDAPTLTLVAWDAVQKTALKLAATHDWLMRDVLGSLSGSALDVLKTVSSSDANELKHLKEVALLNNGLLHILRALLVGPLASLELDVKPIMR